MTDEEFRKLLARHLEAENAHRLAGTLGTLAPDCLFEDVALGRRFDGHEGAAAYYRMWCDGFETEVSPERLYFARGDVAVAETTWRGGSCRIIPRCPGHQAPYRDTGHPGDQRTGRADGRRTPLQGPGHPGRPARCRHQAVQVQPAAGLTGVIRPAGRTSRGIGPGFIPAERIASRPEYRSSLSRRGDRRFSMLSGGFPALSGRRR